MRIELKKGYNSPSENQNVIVELENGTTTGALFIPVNGTPLESNNCYKPVGVPCNVFLSPVVAWFTE